MDTRVSRGRRAVFAALVSAALLATSNGCGSSHGAAPVGHRSITMGFAQVGAESGWRIANTKSIQDAARAAGINLDFQNGKQEQDNQITAIQGFVDKKVDVIAFSPVVESGWDSVLQAAKDAKIPVILTDRAIDTTDTTFYRSFLGSDFVAEGRKAGRWLIDQYRGKTARVNVVEIEGTTGSAPANDRRAGFADVIKADPHLTVIASKDGNFTRDKGQEVMAGFLKQYPRIDVVYAHNDEEGLGAIKAIEAAGKKPGIDIKIITVDATRDGMRALAAGKINFIVECNPLLGPQLMDLAKKVVAGQSVPARVVTNETIFDQAQARTVLSSRQY
jgi:ABC-type sugar transport system substrate-binding protein